MMGGAWDRGSHIPRTGDGSVHPARQAEALLPLCSAFAPSVVPGGIFNGFQVAYQRSSPDGGCRHGWKQGIHHGRAGWLWMEALHVDRIEGGDATISWMVPARCLAMARKAAFRGRHSALSTCQTLLVSQSWSGAMSRLRKRSRRPQFGPTARSEGVLENALLSSPYCAVLSFVQKHTVPVGISLKPA